MYRPSIVWIGIFGLLWWALAGGSRGAWIAGALAVAGAAFIQAALSRGGGPRLHGPGVLAFIPYVLGRAFRGGVDVARRAFSPRLPLDPDLLVYAVRLEEGPARTLFVNVISLLPGTFSADLEGATLTVHLLAHDQDAGARLEQLERKVAGVFGFRLAGSSEENPE